MYGKTLRLGLMLPCVNTVAEPEFARMAPVGVQAYAARMLMRGGTKLEQLAYMENALDDTIESLADAADLFVYGCTSGSFIKGAAFDQAVSERITAKTGKPAVTASQSLVRAVQAFGVSRIALATPYIREVNERQIRFFESCGIETAACRGLELTARGASGRKEPEEVLALAKETMQGTNVQMLVISCTNFRSVELLDCLEQELGVPVVSSNQAAFWNALRTANLTDKVDGFGSLLRL